MGKLLSREEADEIARAIAEEWGLGEFQLKRVYDPEQRGHLIQVIHVATFHGVFNRKYTETQVILRANNREEALLSLKAWLSKELGARAEQADKLRREYADQLLEEELKKKD